MIFISLALAVIPPIGFMIFILYMDRNEPEPVWFVILVLLFGMLSVIPAAILELLIGTFLPFLTINAITVSFFQVAWVEEIVKLAVILIFVWRNRNFNEENDGIVYMGAAAIGFALAENIMYVVGAFATKSGLQVAILRAVTAIPLHTFTGVIMGYFVGLAKFSKKGDVFPKILAGFGIAYAVHAVYDSFALSQNAIAILIVPVVIGLFIFGFISLFKGRKLSLRRWEDKDTHILREEIKKKKMKEKLKHIKYSPEDVKTDKNGNKYIKRKGRLWQIIISRILFGICLFAWLLFIFAFFYPYVDQKITLEELFVGGTVITILPVLIGAFFEFSYHWRKNKKIYIIE